MQNSNAYDHLRVFGYFAMVIWSIQVCKYQKLCLTFKSQSLVQMQTKTSNAYQKYTWQASSEIRIRQCNIFTKQCFKQKKTKYGHKMQTNIRHSLDFYIHKACISNYIGIFLIVTHHHKILYFKLHFKHPTDEQLFDELGTRKAGSTKNSTTYWTCKS